MTHKLIRYLFISLALLLGKPVYSAQITVSADFNPVLLSDSFHLTFEATGSVDDDPDFSPLEKDFDILSRSQSSNISIINGNYKRSTRWTLTLMAKDVGVFTIPSIAFGRDHSPQMQLTVKPASASAGKTYGTLKNQLLELESSTDQTWVQGQIIVTVRLLSAQNINSYRFSDLKIDNMDVVTEQLGDDRQYKTYRGNTPYLVIERRYALFPQQTGKLDLHIIGEMDVIKSSRNNSFFDPFGRNTQTRRLRSQVSSIQVKDIPASFKGRHWLPANEIQLVEEWPDNAEFKVGEPVTRTLSILADGLTSAQLPELSLPDIDGLKQYPDQPSLNDNKKADGIIGIRQEKVALIPTRPGRFTLPAIEIPWWNVKTGREEIARLPAKTITVVAGQGTTANPPAMVPQVMDTSTQDSSPPQITTEADGTATNKPDTQVWIYTSLFFAIAWLATLLAWWRYSGKTPAREKHVPVHNRGEADLKKALKQLKAACQSNNAQACKDALIHWGQALLNQPTLNSLGQLAAQLDEPLRERIEALNQSLYSQQAQDWQAADLYELCLRQQPKTTRKVTDSEGLEPLYRS